MQIINGGKTASENEVYSEKPDLQVLSNDMTVEASTDKGFIIREMVGKVLIEGPKRHEDALAYLSSPEIRQLTNQSIGAWYTKLAFARARGELDITDSTIDERVAMLAGLTRPSERSVAEDEGWMDAHTAVSSQPHLDYY